jgi:hypothetical protein
MWTWLLLALLFLVLQVLLMDLTVGLYDEGLSLYGAVRVLHGDLPYRDFWTMYGPGQFYVLAASFRLFGVYGLCGRVLFLLTNTVSLVAILRILDELTGRLRLSLLTTLIVLLWISTIGSYTFPVYPALTLILIATLLMLRRWREDAPRFALYAGVALGFTALFRHDLALYALVALSLTAAAYAWTETQPCRDPRWLRASSDFFRLSLVSFAVVLPVAILLLLFVPTHDLFYSLFYVPGHIYPEVRALPFPHLRQVVHGFVHLRHVNTYVQPGDAEYNIVWFPLLTGLAAVLWLFSSRRQPALPRWQRTGHLALLLLTAFLFLKGIVRVAPLHMLQAVVPALMLLGCLVAQLRSMRSAVRAVTVFTVAWLALCFVGVLHRDFHTFRVNLARLRPSDGAESLASLCHPPPGLGRARCLSLTPSETQAILYVQAHTRPTDKIFVGAGQYDRLFANDISFYFFSARGSATKWHDLHPGVETTAPIQRQMIADLTRNHAVYVVREVDQPWEPNASRFSSGVMLLGNYIDANYRLERSFGNIDLLRRITPFAPSAANPAMSPIPQQSRAQYRVIAFRHSPPYVP